MFAWLSRLFRRTPSLSEWEHRGTIRVRLERGLTVRFQLPDLAYWITDGANIPNPLRAVAEKTIFGVVQPGKMNTAERRSYYRFQARAIAAHLRSPDVLAMSGGDLDRAEEWVATRMPPAHRELLWLRCVHIVPEEVVASIEKLVPFRPDEQEPAGDGEPDLEADE